MLIGDEHKWCNPKLSNIDKGWETVTERYVAFVDSNVEMNSFYLSEAIGMLRSYRTPFVGAVSSPPVGSDPLNFWAELECAFLNTHQARWQLLADAFGFGFAQGKNLVFESRVLRNLGDLAIMDSESAEDAAITRAVRRAGMRVALLNQPTPQPIGYRWFRDVWNRQVRWARLRRATFPGYFVPELLVGFFPILVTLLFGSGWQTIAVFAIIWYGAEVLLAFSAGWYMSLLYVPACIMRDILSPAVWVAGWGKTFTWKGHKQSTSD
jgi:ceramide glucosyltransferase